MNIIEKNIEDIKPYENNPRKNEKAVKYVANSIKEFGFKVPIIVDSNNVIIAGHTRYKAAKKLGYATIPCIVASDLTPKQVRAFRLVDNKTGELAEWDLELLNNELSELLDFEMLDFGFENVCDEKLLEGIVEDEPPELDEKIPPISQYGDVWKLGRHRLMCGDSTKEVDVMLLMDNCNASLAITDPPYNVSYEGKNDEKMTMENDSMSSEDFKAFLTKSFISLEKVLLPGSSFYIWHSSSEQVNFETALKNAGLQVRQQLIWNKNAMTIGRQDYQWKHEPCLYGWKSGAAHHWYADRKQSTILDYDRPIRNDLHPTMKPIGLIAYQISNSSKPDDKVVDLFGGSGSTLIACEQMSRDCYCMELDPRYCDVIIKRWEALTGEKAILLDKS